MGLGVRSCDRDLTLIRVSKELHMPFRAPSADIVVIAFILAVVGIIAGNFALLGLGALGMVVGGTVAMAAGSKA
jgi:hypothetical protein